MTISSEGAALKRINRLEPGIDPQLCLACDGAGMIDPDMLPILERGRANPAPDYETMSHAEGQATVERLTAYWNTQEVPMERVADYAITRAGGTIAARLFVPTREAETGPVLIYVHGGGWTFGSIATHERACRMLAADSGMRALSIDYRLSPEHPFPAGQDDVSTAIRFVEIGGLGKPVKARHIAVSGDSAGANIALSALLARNRLKMPQLGTAALFYGCYAPDFDTASHRDFGDGSYILSSSKMRWYWQNYLGRDVFTTKSLAAPSRASLPELGSLPPLYMNAAGLDCLRDDTLILAARLAEAGCGFHMDIVPGVIHGFMQMSSELPAARAAQLKAGRYLKDHFRNA